MNWALWQRSFLAMRAQLAACAVLLFGFNWVFVWLSSRIDLGALGMFLGMLPKEWQRVSPIPMADIATPAGRIGLAYVDPVVLFTITVWGIARGSDAVSGELSRGTLEMVVAQPVRRSTVLWIQAAATTLGGALLASVSWLGTWVGLATVRLPEKVQIAPEIYLPAAANLFGLAFFLAAMSTLLSACDRYRWRTIGIAGGVYVVSLVLKIVARMAPEFDWLMYFSFLGAFEPLLFVNQREQAWPLLLQYNGLLVGLGFVAYFLAVLIFSRRDLPAPL